MLRRRWIAALLALDGSGAQRWAKSVGSAASGDMFTGVDADGAGSLYVTGQVAGALPGQTFSGGGADAFVQKYDTAGSLLWTRQFGTAMNELGYDVAVGPDVPIGPGWQVAVAGQTQGALAGQSSAGGVDAFVRVYDGSGALQWTDQFGTGTDDRALAAAVDSDGNVYAAGVVTGALPGQTAVGGISDAFLRKYDTGGTEQWTRQFGTTDSDAAYGLAVGDEGDVLVVGITNGSFPGQTLHSFGDTFVQRYDAAGNAVDTLQFGADPPGTTHVWGTRIAVGPEHEIYTVGRTDGALSGQTHAGAFDAFLIRLEGGCCDADVNGDGTVTIADFTAFAACFNLCPPTPGCVAADVNCNGCVNAADFGILTCQLQAGFADPACCEERVMVPSSTPWALLVATALCALCGIGAAELLRRGRRRDRRQA